jgi:hypothetical protein
MRPSLRCFQNFIRAERRPPAEPAGNLPSPTGSVARSSDCSRTSKQRARGRDRSRHYALPDLNADSQARGRGRAGRGTTMNRAADRPHRIRRHTRSSRGVQVSGGPQGRGTAPRPRSEQAWPRKEWLSGFRSPRWNLASGPPRGDFAQHGEILLSVAVRNRLQEAVAHDARDWQRR